MKTRLITSAIGIPFLIFVLVVRGWFAELLIVLISLIAVWEYYHALTEAKFNVFPWGGYLACLAMWPMSRMMGVLDPLVLLMSAMGVSLTGVLLSKNPTFPDAAASVYPLFTCLMPMSMFMVMVNSVYGQIAGIALITMTFAISFCCDGAAYFGGRFLGKRKLCPSVSPKKTVEGAAFGVLGAVLGAIICRWVFVHAFRMAMPGMAATVLLGVIGSVAGQIGDLTASLLKRYSGLKDYGNLFPGHGGMMDRFDSVIFVLVVMYCFVSAHNLH